VADRAGEAAAAAPVGPELPCEWHPPLLPAARLADAQPVALLDLLWEYAITGRILRARGHAVVCDRWICDALVDLRVNFPQDRLEKRLLWRLVTKLALRPDASFLLLIPAQESLRRAHESGRRNVEPREVLEARLLEYQRISATDLGDPIDAARPPEAIAKELTARLDTLLHRAQPAPSPVHLAVRTK
jgi:thymidylate kinase